MTRPILYVLDDDHTPVPITDRAVWAAWFDDTDRTVARDVVGDTLVSTVFLGIDHQYGIGPPVLFETMVFVHGEAQPGCVRSSTWAEAEHAHALVLADAREVLAQEARKPDTASPDHHG
jgi:hypothetical protein